MRLDYEEYIKYLIMLLKIIFLILAVLALIFYIIFEYNKIIPIRFEALGAISTTITALVGVPLLIITFQYLNATRAMVDEMRKQRIAIEEPALSIKAVPSTNSLNILNLVLKNTGGSAAYNISICFDPDIPYKDITLNQLNVFQNMSVLDKNEFVEQFFASAPEYFKSDKPKKTKATIKYYLTPFNKHAAIPDPRVRTIELDFEERKDQLQIKTLNMNDLVKEIEELKQGLLLIAREIEEKKSER